MATSKNSKFKTGRIVLIAGVVILLICMGLGTKVLTGKQATAAAPGTFSAEAWAKEHYPKVSAHIIKSAADVHDVQAAISVDPEAAAKKKFGNQEGKSAPVFSVELTGVAGTAENGVMPVTVDALPSDLKVAVQMGPAINGTAIRDATGTVHFPQFTNQIEYQDAGAELNNQVKKKVLAKRDAAKLEGKTVTITGAFQLINPKYYLITPVKIEVGK